MDFLSNSYPHYTKSYVNLHDSSDVKYTWEYGRLQWLIYSSYLYTSSPSSEHLSLLKCSLFDFFDNNPCSHGIHWSCTMDVSFRALSLLKIYHVLNPNLDTHQKTRLQRILYQHYIFILSNLELSTINGNHLNSNLAALIHLSLFFSDIPLSSLLRFFIRHISVYEFSKQFDSTGYNFEGSLPYLRLNVELFVYIFYPFVVSGRLLSNSFSTRILGIRHLLSVLTKSFSIDLH